MESQDHSIEVHIAKLQKLCRICGSKSTTRALERKKNGSTLCKNYKDSILAVFKIDVSNDIYW